MTGLRFLRGSLVKGDNRVLTILGRHELFLVRIHQYLYFSSLTLSLASACVRSVHAHMCVSVRVYVNACVSLCVGDGVGGDARNG